MQLWLQQLQLNPLPSLINTQDKALDYFVKRDLLDEEYRPVEVLWQLPEVRDIIEKQQQDGSWKYPRRGPHAHPNENYDLLETYRVLRVLVEQYGFSKHHTAIHKTAEYLLTHQSAEGDIRGTFGSQYAPHYTAGILELLTKSGYEGDARVKLGFAWCISQRQNDGGWAWPLRSANVSYQQAIEQPDPVQSARSKPFSHALTGFILRAFAAHPIYRISFEARQAGELLKSRFFKPDKYSDRRAAHYWIKFQYPFWWANLLTALDSLYWIGFDLQDEDIQKGLSWFQNNQESNGLWSPGYGKGRKVEIEKLWIGLAVCRILKRFYGVSSIVHP
jgi:hypothetical protein